MSLRQVVESPVEQGVNETIRYTIDTTNWDATPTSPVVTADDITNLNSVSDVSGTVLSGSSSVAAPIITTSIVQSLTAKHTYRINVQFTDSNSNVLETFFVIHAK